MTSYAGYDQLASTQYFTINSYIYAMQPTDTSRPPAWMSRYREPLKLELRATSNMTLEQVLMLGLPDLNVSQCQLFVSQTHYRTGHAAREGKREASQSELAIRQRDKVLMVQMRAPLEVDTRHRLLVSLLDREDRTLESLQNIYGLLESIELVKGEYVVFTPLQHLIELISSFNSDLRKRVWDTWDPLWVQIGTLFLSFKSLWSKHYATYFRAYKEMSGFVDSKRRHTFMLPGNADRERNSTSRLNSVYNKMEEILSMPFDQVDHCETILHSILMDHTPHNHPDRESLHRAHQLVKETLQIAKNEKQACDNERALKLVQDKFHNEILLLYSKNPLETFQAFKKLAPNSVLPPRSRLRPQLSRHREESQTSDTSRTTTQSSEMFAPPPRTLIKEGAFSLVHMQSPQHKHERYLVLLTDLIIMAKPSHHHKTTGGPVAQATPALSLKQLIPLQFVWTCATLENGLEPYNAHGFLIGWPAENTGVNNFVAIFSNAEERRQWLDTINNTIEKARQDLPPIMVSVHVLTDPPKSFAKECCYAVQTCHLQEDTFVSLTSQPSRQYLTRDNFVFLLVLKESQQYPLSGFESVAAIKSYYSYLASWRKGHQSVSPDSSWCCFQMKQLTSEEQHGGIRKRFMSQFHFKKPRYQHPLQDTPGRLFHLPLETVMPPPNHNIPNVLKCILVKLYRQGPRQQGIFRVEGSNREVTELTRRVQEGDTVDWEECRVVVVGNLFKRFLRSIPGCLLPSSKYTEFAATNDIKEQVERVERIKKILSKIPLPNYKLSQLVFFMLAEVAQNVSLNQMTPSNLGIAVGPSILQPMEGLSVYQLEMHNIVSFIVHNYPQVYGSATPDIFSRTQSPSKQNLQLVPVNDGSSPRRQLTRGDSNDSMEFDQRSCDSGESETVTTPTNEHQGAQGAHSYRKDSTRYRFNSENDIQREEQNRNRNQELQVLKKNISIEVTESPNNHSKSTPNSPEVARSVTAKLELIPADCHSHSSPNTPEATRATFIPPADHYTSSDEERPVPFTSPLYHKQRAANQLSTPLAPSNYAMTSHHFQAPNYYRNPPPPYSAYPSNPYGMQPAPRVTGTSNSFPREITQNNMRHKSGSLVRSPASHELSYPLPFRDTRRPNGPKSHSYEETGRMENVLPLCIQKAKAVIVIFPVIQDAQIAKASEMTDVSRV